MENTEAKNLCPFASMSQYVRLCSVMFGYVRLCSVMFGYVRLCSAMCGCVSASLLTFPSLFHTSITDTTHGTLTSLVLTPLSRTRKYQLFYFPRLAYIPVRENNWFTFLCARTKHLREARDALCLRFRSLRGRIRRNTSPDESLLAVSCKL